MLVYLYSLDSNRQRGLGIENKINGQVKAFNNNGIVTQKIGCKILPKIQRIFPFSSSSIDWCKVNLENVTSLYVRYPLSDYQFIKFLKRAKSNNIRLYLEIATFPYEKELKKANIIVRMRDKLYSRFIKKYVDHIFYMGGQKEVVSTIFGVKCSRISNGIDFDNYRITKRKSENVIRLISVAQFQVIHGYERIIKGIFNYYKNGGNRSIDFVLIGEGPELDSYKQLVNNLSLNDRIHFKGKLTGELLDEEFDNADIGVESFGFYKIGVSISSSLKSREYLARGLPFISGIENDIISKNFPFCLQFKNDSSEINIQSVIDFYDLIYTNKKFGDDVGSAIREYGEQKASWNRTMELVFSYVAKS